MTHQFEGEEQIIDEGGLTLRQKLNLVATALLVVALGLFIFQNTESQNISFLSFEPDMPLWLLVLGSAIAGAILATVGSALRRRRKRK